MEFKDKEFDQALRQYLQKKFMLPGEAQKISRIMEAFAARFVSQNPSVFPDEDTGFILAFSLIMLNTDAHNPSIPLKDKMTLQQFVRNNRGTWAGKDPPLPLLEKLYNSIVNDEIKFEKAGDKDAPAKSGWAKHFTVGQRKTGSRWLVLTQDHQLQIYKKKTKAKAGDEQLVGRIKLERLLTRIEESEDKKIAISYSLGGNYQIEVTDKDDKKMEVQWVDKVFLHFENATSAKQWVAEITRNTKYAPITSQLPSQPAELPLRRKQKEKKKRSLSFNKLREKPKSKEKKVVEKTTTPEEDRRMAQMRSLNSFSNILANSATQ